LQLLPPSLSVTDPASTGTYPLSLHDALPISAPAAARRAARYDPTGPCQSSGTLRVAVLVIVVSEWPTKMSIAPSSAAAAASASRSEEHTSELQSHLNLVCRLLLEKKKRAGPYQAGDYDESGHAQHLRLPHAVDQPHQPRRHYRAGAVPLPARIRSLRLRRAPRERG